MALTSLLHFISVIIAFARSNITINNQRNFIEEFMHKKTHSNAANHHNEYIHKLAQEENEHLARLNNIVVESLHEEEALVRKLFSAHKKEHSTMGQKLADRVATLGGSWGFIIFFATVVVGWMIINNALAMHQEAFDSYPYILLNLLLSCLAAFQAPIILMSQNRQSFKDRKRDEHEYLINLKAELQIRELNRKIDLLISEQMKVFMDIQEEQLKLLSELSDKADDVRKSSRRKPS